MLLKKKKPAFLSAGQDQKPVAAPDDKSPKKYSTLFFVLTLILFALSISVVRLMAVGLPVRSLFGLGLFALLFLSNPSFLKDGIQKMAPILLVIGYAAGLGAFVSFLNQVPILTILRQIAEIHCQAAVAVLTGYGLLTVMGPKKLIYAFICVVGFSAVFALFQSIHVDFAWRVREFLQTIQTYDYSNVFLDKRLRAMGLSFTPVHLGTQLCLAFALSIVVRMNTYKDELKKGFYKRIALPLTLALFVAIISGNRSPLLGLFVFVAGYIFYARPSLSLLLALIFLPILTFLYMYSDVILEFLANTGLRAFRTGDKSSAGREALRAYGWLLFVNKPFGYGLAFSSTVHVSTFWSELAGFENAKTVWTNAVHNYYLNVLHKYGLLIIPIALFVGRVLVNNMLLLLAFIPYIVHIFFHNDGPLQSDFLIWYFLPAVVTLLPKNKIKKAPPINYI